MTRPFRSRMKTCHKGALVAIAAVLSLAACDPATPAGSPSATAGVSSSPSAISNPSPSSTPSPATTPTTATPTPPAPSAAPPTTAAPAPAPERPHTEEPAPEPTKASTDCYPRSNAGNCYKAGQICRKADVGTSGRDAGGRAIYCRHDSSVGQRWGY
ncbi:hypothetical protein [Streptomyces sp. NPDC127112]|uniref:hypothetical protein n=1 Tax=Streptomyces sp. NPDC127112 TaxID=3345364 RepID=UPI00362DC370